jgi:hypothetical protein
MALDMAAIRHAVNHYGLPANLKLSVHSGSDKFSIYPAIHASMKKFSTGVHLKTAGTTWLEELIGLAEAGGDGLALAKEIYAEALCAFAPSLCAPYATVIDIDPANCPLRPIVDGWSSGAIHGSALRHDEAARLPTTQQPCANCCMSASRLRPRWARAIFDLLEANETIVAKNVTENLYARHISPVFLGR